MTRSRAVSYHSPSSRRRFTRRPRARGLAVGRLSARGALRRLRRSRRRADGAAPTSQVRRGRLVLLAASIGVGLLTIGARCTQLQILRAPELLDQARSQQEKAITLDPHRGLLLDRNGKELALSLEVDSIFADPAEIGDAAAVSRRLAPLLGLKPAEMGARLESDRHFVWLKRKVSPDLKRQVEALDLRGVGFVRESRRYYPKRALAAHVIGACGVDNQGLAGLEFAYDGAIQGTPGRILFQRDGRGGRVLDRSRTEPTAGLGLVLTIDEVIQHIAERELDTVMAAFAPVGASVVVMRPQTGELLALASRPTFDPNDYAGATPDAKRNRAVTDYYEPGSTFKVMTAAAALDAGRVHPNEVIWCENGSIVVGRHRFKEDRLPYGNLSFTEVLAKSSNVGAIKVAARLQAREFLDYIRSFGFGRKTGVELPGESAGMLRDLEDWSGLSQASIAMGQEIGATPLQLATAMAAVANDGLLLPPSAVGETIGADGRRRPAGARRGAAGRRVISEATARTLRTMLQSVTIYSHGRYVAWFAGFVPAGKPALTIVVMVDEPRGPKFHGGDVAAPVFSRIALPVLQYLGVPADSEGPLVFDRSVQASLRPEGEDRRRDRASSDMEIVLPAARRSRSLRGSSGGLSGDPGSPREESVVASAMSLPARAAPGGALHAVSHLSDSGAPPPSGVAGGPAMMPDLSGMSLRQASERLASAGIVCRTVRSGPRVTRQEPEPGLPVAGDGRCTVIF